MASDKEEAWKKHLEECTKGKVSVNDECNCDACSVCFLLKNRPKDPTPELLRDEDIAWHMFVAGTKKCSEFNVVECTDVKGKFWLVHKRNKRKDDVPVAEIRPTAGWIDGNVIAEQFVIKERLLAEIKTELSELEKNYKKLKSDAYHSIHNSCIACMNYQAQINVLKKVLVGLGGGV